jgi:hypothetical protein
MAIDIHTIDAIHSELLAVSLHEPMKIILNQLFKNFSGFIELGISSTSSQILTVLPYVEPHENPF